ncbi:leucine-rich repeat domain-containing protein [Paenibacillus xylaniclasticus]|uniref:leucine-rich repeat domain-containing protein n=1 Tax=Paenibacillus xylaniclasticus TaxID=588083 RepID=UPI000FDA7CCF|nr:MULTISPECIES: stalk domain-containing protein [Paenibacillus]GFN32293.1 hypothetical protein PCURB6_25530 [Paenibacillus curdlanolyticus]
MRLKAVTFILAFLLVLPATHATAQSKHNLSIFVEGNQIAYNIAPFVENGRTIVEARSLFEALGIKLTWDARSKTVTGTKSGLKLQMKMNQNNAVVNGNKVVIDTVPRVVKGKTLIPLRFVSTVSGAEVLWSNAKQRIDVNGLQFKDSRLESLVRSSIGKLNSKLPILQSDVAQLTHLESDILDLDPPRVVYEPSDLSGIEQLTALKSLTIQGDIRSLEPLSKLKHLESLDIKSNAKDISPLGKIKSLKKLSVNFIGSDLSGLSSLSQLTSLEIDAPVQKLDGISRLTQLKELSIAGHEALSDVAPLSSLKNLNKLTFTERNSISDVTPLSHLTQLKELTITASNISDVSPLHTLINLNKLTIGPAQIEDISSLHTLVNLKELYIWRNELTSLAGVEGLSSLKHLDVRYTRVQDLEPLRQLNHLEWLTLVGNNIDSIEPLSGASNLKTLDAESNQITSLQPLLELPAIEDVGLSNNPLNDLTFIGQLQDHPTLKLLLVSGDEQSGPMLEQFKQTFEDKGKSLHIL